MEERERQCQTIRIGAIKTGAADHDIHAMFQHISPDAVPQQFHCAFVAMWRLHAGAAELEKSQVAVARNEGANIEFTGAVESARPLSNVLTQQSIGANDCRPLLQLSCPMIDDQEMVAHGVEKVDVASREIE